MLLATVFVFNQLKMSSREKNDFTSYSRELVKSTIYAQNLNSVRWKPNISLSTSWPRILHVLHSQSGIFICVLMPYIWAGDAQSHLTKALTLSWKTRNRFPQNNAVPTDKTSQAYRYSIDVSIETGSDTLDSLVLPVQLFIVKTRYVMDTGLNHQHSIESLASKLRPDSKFVIRVA